MKQEYQSCGNYTCIRLHQCRTFICYWYSYGIASYSGVILFKEKLKIDDTLDVSSVHGDAEIIGSLTIGIFASSAINPNGLLFGNSSQLGIQDIDVGVAGELGFFGTWIIIKVIKFLVGVRVSPQVEDDGLYISEHAEQAYADEEEFKLDMDQYVNDLRKKMNFSSKNNKIIFLLKTDQFYNYIIYTQ
mgnify:FL=1